MGLEVIIILSLAIIFGLYMAWNIGANDVANAMGTSVGSGALTLKRAVVVAALLEFGGAFFVGGHVTETVRKGMIDLGQIQNPETLMIGMVGAMMAAGVWLHFATHMRWPVSTTQSIVGAIVGFGIVIAGFGAINWSRINSIVASWFVSPLLSAVISILLFYGIRKLIIDARDPLKSIRIIAPILIFLVFVVLALVITFKGLKNLHLDLSFTDSIMISLLAAAGPALIGWWLISMASKKVALKRDEALKNKSYDSDRQLSTDKDHPIRDEYSFVFVENVFKYIQILSACSVAFAHGANDVANAIGPMAAVWEIATTGVIVEKIAVHPLLPALGGLGIVLGLATWGWKIIETIGERITDLTPSRGFAAEFGAACTILTASKLGLPVSTTHCLVGAVVGVGIARGVASLDLKMLWKIFLSWVIEIPAAAILSIIFYFILSAIFI